MIADNRRRIDNGTIGTNNIANRKSFKAEFSFDLNLVSSRLLVLIVFKHFDTIFYRHDIFRTLDIQSSFV